MFFQSPNQWSQRTEVEVSVIHGPCQVTYQVLVRSRKILVLILFISLSFTTAENILFYHLSVMDGILKFRY